MVLISNWQTNPHRYVLRRRFDSDAVETAQLAVAASTEVDTEIKLIQANIESYTDAFNDHDAAGVVEHFTEDSELTAAGGDTIKGHDAMLKDMEDHFQSTKDAKLILEIVSVSVIVPSVALAPGPSQYTARCSALTSQPA